MNILEKKKRMGSERNINEANTLKNSPASVVSRTALGMWSSENTDAHMIKVIHGTTGLLAEKLHAEQSCHLTHP